MSQNKSLADALRKPGEPRDEPPPRRFLKLLGPGLITGASDDDPSGIATYSQAGAQSGYSVLWTVVFVYPLMAAIQEVSALIGRVTGHGIAGNIRRYYSAWVLYPIVFLLLAANIINLAADISAMGEAVKLLIGGPARLYLVILAAVSVVMQIRIPYSRYAKILRWLCLALFTYVATVFSVKIDWAQAFRGTFIPHLAFSGKDMTLFIAILGTTISPYLFFWQASGEVEEVEKNETEKPLLQAPDQAPEQMARIQWDTYMGMGFSNLVAFFIMLTVAATLHQQGQAEIETAAQAAEALRPVAGPLAFFLFAAGIVGTGMLALPVLAGSAAYAVGETMKWPTGLERQAKEAKGFYAVIAIATLLGVVLNFTHLDPIKALFWSAVINGVVAGPLMVIMMLMTTNPKVMGQFTLSPYIRFTGWLATLLMIAASVGLFVTWGK